MKDLTIQDREGRGWTVRFLEQAEYAKFKADEKFGLRAARAVKLKGAFPSSEVFQGALAYHEGRVVTLLPKNLENWLKSRHLKAIQL